MKMGLAHSLRWSDETYRIFGHEPGRLAVDHDLFASSVHPDDRALLLRAAGAGIAAGDGFETEFRIVRPDGAVRTVHAWTTVERDAAGRATRLRGTCQDITERKRAEPEMQRTREHLQVVVDATPALIARYDPCHPAGLGQQDLRGPLRQEPRAPRRKTSPRDRR